MTIKYTYMLLLLGAFGLLQADTFIDTDHIFKEPGKAEKTKTEASQGKQNRQTKKNSPKPVKKLPKRALVIVLTGNTGFSKDNAEVNRFGVEMPTGIQLWADATQSIRNQINGQINFTNLETVVTDRNDLTAVNKDDEVKHSFRTHPKAIQQLGKVGFNLFSMTNDHAMDYGVKGLEESLRHMGQLKNSLAFAGIGMNRPELGKAKVFRQSGFRIGFNAVGVIGNAEVKDRARNDKPGQLAYQQTEDFRFAVDKLAATTNLDYRILSIHYGKDREVKVDKNQLDNWRDYAVKEKGINLIVGHSARVPRAVELNGESLIFYGLGNFLHHGTADMSKLDLCRSYAILARVYLYPKSSRLKPMAVQVVPLQDMHYKPRPMVNVKAAHARLHALNYLSAGQDSFFGNVIGTVKGLQFTPQTDGSGLYCFAGAQKASQDLVKLCKGWKPPVKPDEKLLGRIKQSCDK